MAKTTFSGPVQSDNGFIGSVTGGAISATTIYASGSANLASTTNIIIIPTVDPAVAGAIWNDAGTLKVSAGV